MQIEINNDKQSIRRELSLLPLLVVFSICGLLIWTSLFLAVEWSVSAVWAAVVAHQGAASSTDSRPGEMLR